MEQIRREFTIEYPIAKLRAAIESACAGNSGKYLLTDRNPIFNTFSVSVIKGLYVLPVTLTLIKKCDEETTVEVSAISGPGMSRIPTIMSAAIDELLREVGYGTTGELEIRREEARERKRSVNRQISLILTAIVVISAIGFAIYIIHLRR
ncbi:MAG TPA: hypothetical protein VFE32_17160 [Puia sp.]|jgi:hypothetical protein|nr:hypothetical protein [Puia sp.]